MQCNLKQVVQEEEIQDLFSTLDLRGIEFDFQAERDSLHRLQVAQDPGRAAFSLGSPLYLNLFPVRSCLRSRNKWDIELHAVLSFTWLAVAC